METIRDFAYYALVKQEAAILHKEINDRLVAERVPFVVGSSILGNSRWAAISVHHFRRDYPGDLERSTLQIDLRIEPASNRIALLADLTNVENRRVEEFAVDEGIVADVEGRQLAEVLQLLRPKLVEGMMNYIREDKGLDLERLE